jgi:hypothetical protein
MNGRASSSAKTGIFKYEYVHRQKRETPHSVRQKKITFQHQRRAGQILTDNMIAVRTSSMVNKRKRPERLDHRRKCQNKSRYRPLWKFYVLIQILCLHIYNKVENGLGM